MDLLIEGLPKSFDFEKFVGAYAKNFAIKERDNGNKMVTIPHEISPLMIIELLDGQKVKGGKISVKKISGLNRSTAPRP